MNIRLRLAVIISKVEPKAVRPRLKDMKTEEIRELQRQQSSLDPRFLRILPVASPFPFPYSLYFPHRSRIKESNHEISIDNLYPEAIKDRKSVGHAINEVP